MLPWIVEVKTAEEIIKMRAAGKVAREVLDIAGKAVRPGITTDEIDGPCAPRNRCGTFTHNDIPEF